MKLTYEVLSVSDVKDAVDCIAKTFVDKEPMVSCLGITLDEFRHFAELFITKAAEDGLSLAVKDNDRLIAAVINEDLCGDPPAGIESVTPKMNPVMGVLENLDMQYLDENSCEYGEVFHIFMGGVLPEFEGKSIAANMVKESQELAIRKGFKKIVVEATGNTSRYIFERHPKFYEVSRIPYKTYTFEGQYVFSDIKGGTDCVLFEAILE
jgi:ribosomal protein S18 acetylase RimI-like enzyme